MSSLDVLPSRIFCVGSLHVHLNPKLFKPDTWGIVLFCTLWDTEYVKAHVERAASQVTLGAALRRKS